MNEPIPGGGAPQPVGADALTAPPAVPSRADLHDWYGGTPSAAEMVTGELSPDRGGPQGDPMGYEHTTPGGQDNAVPGEPGTQSILRQMRDYEPMRVPDGASIDDARVRSMFGILDGEMGHQERAQKLTDLYFDTAKDIGAEYSKNQKKVWDDLNEGWKHQIRKDPEIGGQKMDESLRRAKAVIDEFTAGPQRSELMRWLDASGMGNHPEVVRMLNKIGEKLNIFEEFSAHGRPPNNAVARVGGRGWYPTMGGDR